MYTSIIKNKHIYMDIVHFTFISIDGYMKRVPFKTYF